MTVEYQKELIGAPLEEVRNILSKLKVSDTALQALSEAGKEKNPEFDARDVYASWINQVLFYGTNSDEFQSATEDPDDSFFQFGFWVIEHPTEPPMWVVQKMIDQFGFDFVSPLHKITWPREIVWAKRLRSHPDDDVCIAANLFLEFLRKKGPSKVFEKLVTYAHNADISVISFDNPISTIEIDEINEYSISLMEEYPICIGFMLDAARQNPWNLSPDRKIKAADQIRQKCQDEHNSIRKAEMIAYLQEYPIILQHMTAMKAIDLGMTSNQLKSVYDLFLKSISAYQTVGSASELELSFLKFMRQHSDFNDYRSPDPDETKKQIAMINSSWIEMLPIPLKELGGTVRKNFSTWRDAVLSEERERPSDFILDYYLFLLDKDMNFS